jgi:hypothetical protein
MSFDSETLDAWWNGQLLQENFTAVTHEMLMRQDCLSAYDVVKVVLLAEAFRGLWDKILTVDYGALACHADGSH